MPIEQKPLMIRGDRLHTVIEITTHCVDSFGGHRPACLVCGPIIARFGDKAPQALTVATLYHRNVRSDGGWSVLLEGADNLRHVYFHAAALFPLLDPGAQFEVNARRTFCRFFSAIASGELTEGDFQERGSEDGGR